MNRLPLERRAQIPTCLVEGVIMQLWGHETSLADLSAAVESRVAVTPESWHTTKPNRRCSRAGT